jgi:hypothetical protein
LGRNRGGYGSSNCGGLGWDGTGYGSGNSCSLTGKHRRDFSGNARCSSGVEDCGRGRDSFSFPGAGLSHLFGGGNEGFSVLLRSESLSQLLGDIRSVASSVICCDLFG